MLEQRFALEYRQTPTDQPGLVMRDDGVIERVKPDGTRELVPGGGGGGGGGVFVQDTDPGAVGTGNLWVDTSLYVASGLLAFRARNAADDGWDELMTIAGNLDGGLQLFNPTGNELLRVEPNGAFSLFEADGTGSVVWSPGQTAANKNTLAVKNGAGANVFQVRGDGSLHIPAGKTLAADL